MYCFFFRRINDLDQIAPIIYAYSKKKKNITINYICINNSFNFSEHKIIKYLKNQNIKIGYLHNFCLNIFFRLMLNIFFKLFFFFKIKIIIFFFRHLIDFFYKILITEKKIKKFIIKEKISNLVFDFPFKKTNYVDFFIQKENNLKIIGIEHGVLTFKNLNYLNKFDRRKYLYNNKFFDTILLPNSLSYKRLKSIGFEKKKLKVVGCLRFSFRWNYILRKHIFYKKNLIKKNKINIVLMDHGDKYGVNKKKYENFINFIANLKNINFRIKPNTASFGIDGISSNNINKNLISSDHSVDLINWADIVVCLSSSIIFDALINKKFFFYPSFLHKNKMIWENNRGCLQFNSFDQFKKMLLSLNRDKLKVIKKKQNTEYLLNKNIFNNKKRLELSDYINENLL
jgi:hypothetical protein